MVGMAGIHAGWVSFLGCDYSMARAVSFSSSGTAAGLAGWWVGRIRLAGVG